jgi:hypothetical protein
MESSEQTVVSLTVLNHVQSPRNLGPLTPFSDHARTTGPCGVTPIFRSGGGRRIAERMGALDPHRPQDRRSLRRGTRLHHQLRRFPDSGHHAQHRRSAFDGGRGIAMLRTRRRNSSRRVTTSVKEEEMPCRGGMEPGRVGGDR